MGNCAGQCLIFQPTLGQCMGQSIAQMLAEMGMGMPGSGAGMGSGMGMGGTSARRGGVGLYGGLPGMGQNFGDGPQGSGPSDRSPGSFSTGGTNPDESPLIDSPAMQGAAGIGEGAVPIRFRRRVGQYFQRIAEEAGE